MVLPRRVAIFFAKILILISQHDLYASDVQFNIQNGRIHHSFKRLAFTLYISSISPLRPTIAPRQAASKTAVHTGMSIEGFRGLRILFLY